MLLNKIHIQNFRGIKELEFVLDDTTIIVGENNTGKSTILDAIEVCLGRRMSRRNIFSEYDYHLEDENSEPSGANPISITLYFKEHSENEWKEIIPQLLSDVIQIDDNNLTSVILKLTSKYDSEIRDFTTEWEFLDLNGSTLQNSIAEKSRALGHLQQFIPVFYLSAIRDAASEFRPRSQFWAPFVKSLNIDPQKRIQLEESLKQLNEEVLDAHQSFSSVKESLHNAGKFVPLSSDDPVSIEALPGKVFDVLGRAQVLLTSKSGVKLPLHRHGDGTQSLAVICLFEAFLESSLSDNYHEHAEPLLALEEPEAHLHPSATKSVVEMLQSFKGQKIIVTHSGELLSGVPLKKIRRLRRVDDELKIYCLDETIFLEDEIDKMNHHVRLKRGNIILARCWLLIEGETESIVFNECAQILGYDLFSEGICCIEYAQVGLEKFIKLADQLGIEWFMVSDNDPQGITYESTAKSHLNSRSEHDHIHLLSDGNIEVCLCMNGYGDIYENNKSPQKQITVAKSDTVEYWKDVINAQPNNSKTTNAFEVIDKMKKDGEPGVPSELEDILTRTLKLSKEAI